MEFINQVLSAAGADTLNSFTVVPSFGAYFKGVRAVVELSPEKIVLSSGKIRITVCGNALAVGTYFGGDMFVSGNVSGVTIE